MVEDYLDLKEHMLVQFAGALFFIQEIEMTPSFGKEPSVVKHIVLSQVECLDSDE